MTHPYLTAEQLGITPEEHAGLIELEQHLRGEVCVIDRDDLNMIGVGRGRIYDDAIATVLGFSMSFGAGVPSSDEDKSFDCGCVACIGGHLSLKMQGVDIRQRLFPVDELIEANRYVMNLRDRVDHPLHKLFYPSNKIIHPDHWDDITPIVAADAIVNFLTTRDPNWEKLVETYGLTPAPMDDEHYVANNVE